LFGCFDHIIGHGLVEISGDDNDFNGLIGHKKRKFGRLLSYLVLKLG
jgi:hypothetical protein